MSCQMRFDKNLDSFDGQSSYEHLLHLLSNELLNFERSLASLASLALKL